MRPQPGVSEAIVAPGPCLVGAAGAVERACGCLSGPLGASTQLGGPGSSMCLDRWAGGDLAGRMFSNREAGGSQGTFGDA